MACSKTGPAVSDSFNQKTSSLVTRLSMAREWSDVYVEGIACDTEAKSARVEKTAVCVNMTMKEEFYWRVVC